MAELPFLRTLLFCCFGAAVLAASAPAQTTQTAPDPSERDGIANRFVHEILPYWQKRLHLDDWTVHVLLSRPGDLRQGTLGNVHWDAEKKSATIHVMDASGYVGSSGEPMALTPMLRDMEVTVVHELVHLELASLPVSDADRSNQETAIDNLTEALLESRSANGIPLQ